MSQHRKSVPIAGAVFSTQIAQQFVTAVTAPPLVGCVVWNQCLYIVVWFINITFVLIYWTYYTYMCVSRANIMVACKVTPAIWLNLSDSRNILIIHIGLLLKERTLYSIGHDLWKKYNVISFLWMIRYISLLTNTFT